MSIFVDTALDVSWMAVYTHKIYHDKPTYEPPEITIDSIGHFRAYPLFINNTCDWTLYLGTHNYLNFMVREVKNEQGVWIPIENFGESFECNGCRAQFLKPHEIMIAKLLRYKGRLKVTCRLKFGTHNSIVYSNTFSDNIDEKMLTPFTSSRY